MTIEKFDIEARRQLTLDEKVDLILDRFLGNPLRGIIGQIELISMLDRGVTDMKASNVEMYQRMQRLEEIIERQGQQLNAKNQENADGLFRHQQEATQRFTALYFWLSVVGIVAIVDGVVLTLHIFGGN